METRFLLPMTGVTDTHWLLTDTSKLLCPNRHGGPGGGTSGRDRRFFDPSVYRIVLMDQRGAGKSLPPAELKVISRQTEWTIRLFTGGLFSAFLFAC